MTRTIRIFTFTAATVLLVALSGMTIGAVADAKAYPTANTHATQQMQNSFPELF